MMRLLPDSLVGRILLALGLIILTLLAGSFYILHEERYDLFGSSERMRLGSRIVTLVRLLQTAEESERLRILRHASDDEFELSLDMEANVKTRPIHPRERMLHHRLSLALPELDKDAIRVKIIRNENAHFMQKFKHGPPPWLKHRSNEHHDDNDHSKYPGEYGRKYPAPFPGAFRNQHWHEPPDEIYFSLQLWNGAWLNIEAETYDASPPWAFKSLLWIFILVTLSIVIGIISARRMALPIKKLSSAADQLGRGVDVSPLKEQGSKEIRTAIRAFNQMQERLQRHLHDRTLMLAAISHDLRTPITTLRLRAEYIDDEEIREKTLATLTEMESILSETLSFSRDEARDEKNRLVDLASLVQSVCDDHADLGADVHYQGPDKFNLECRPTALRRAINNLVENALKYGHTASVTLAENKNEIIIRIDDQGSGIPEEQLEQVFTPFYRVDDSRNRDTGGIGLGLSVARTIIHAHGGVLKLSNLKQGGLRVEIQLPI